MTLNRRQVLKFFSATVVTSVFAEQIFENINNIAQAQAKTTFKTRFTPVRLPHPLPIYQEVNNFLPTAIGKGKMIKAENNVKLTNYQIIDDVVIPPEYERYIILGWGDRLFNNPDEYVGCNCDYTGFIPLDKNFQDGYLWVNHEYISSAISLSTTDNSDYGKGLINTFSKIVKRDLPQIRNIELDGELLYNLGGSIVRISHDQKNQRFVVVKDVKNRRIHGLSGLKINRQRTDEYQKITSWGKLSYQQGDENYLIATGPAATEVFTISSDGLGNKIIGTAYNCSGGTTPWGTILSAEENFQGSSTSVVGVTEAVRSNGTQIGYIPGTIGERFGLVGEKYGWIVEIDPINRNFRPKKHTWLGRYRHENVALRVEAGKKLVTYMGDDRRGGHTYKFVSNGIVNQVTDKSNSDLLASGILYVAKFNPDGTGEWIPLLLNTPTNPIPPSVLSAVEFTALGSAQKEGILPLPRRKGVAGEITDGGVFACTRVNEIATLPNYQNKKLSDFYTSQGAILCDAFLAANLVGGTPTARPEDVEIHPNTKEVFIAYTDGAPSSDGYADSRIFQVAKLDPSINGTQDSGGIYKIIESSSDGTGTSFTWEKFVQGGEAGTVGGAGFANVDNLVFDTQGNIWGVTDMMSINGVNGATSNTVNHQSVGNVSSLTGVFGNNWIFCIPTSGSNAGKVIPFGYGPVLCEMTGPTFVGNTLIISVQHPGENSPVNDGTMVNRNLEILDLDGKTFNQSRTIPRGSSWPSNIATVDGGNANLTGIPRPCVIGIRRKDGGNFL